MSAYYECETEFDNKEVLLSALGLMGWPKEKIQVHTAPVQLRGWHGDLRGNTAEIVIGKEHLTTVSNDLGFRLVDGKWALILSAYDKAALPGLFADAKPGTSFQSILTQAYGMARLEANLRGRAMSYQRPKKLRWGEPLKMKVVVR